MRRLAPTALAVALCLVAEPALAQSPPPCPPGSAKLRVVTLGADRIPRPPRATHATIVAPHVDDEPQQGVVTWSGPPGIQQEKGSSAARLTVDEPGPVAITATWQSAYEPNPEDPPVDCMATKQITLNVLPARPLVFYPPTGYGGELAWNVRIPSGGDLRPVDVRIRGVRQAARPGSRAPARRVRIALRGAPMKPARQIVLAGWTFEVWQPVQERIQVKARPGRPIRPGALPVGVPAGLRFGFEVSFTQAGRLIGRTFVKGSCDASECRPRIRSRKG